jgi:hypothetical protein
MPAIPAYSTHGGPTPPNTPIVTAMAAPIVRSRQTSKFALLPAEILTKILKMDTHSTSISASLTCKKLHVVHGAMKWHRHAYGGTNWYWVQRDIWEEKALWVSLFSFAISRIPARQTVVAVASRCHVCKPLSRSRNSCHLPRLSRHSSRVGLTLYCLVP